MRRQMLRAHGHQTMASGRIVIPVPSLKTAAKTGTSQKTKANPKAPKGVFRSTTPIA